MRDRLSADEIRDQLRIRGIEAHDIQHPAVIRSAMEKLSPPRASPECRSSCGAREAPARGDFPSPVSLTV
jgi:hypothetical protein